MTILDEVGASIRQLAEGAGASVVGIGQRRGAGSGIVLGQGQVRNNPHNVRGDQVTVTFAGGRTAEGSVAGRDVDGDLAVISVDTGETPALAWAGSAPAQIGEPGFAVANPGGAARGRGGAGRAAAEAGEPVFAVANPGGRGLRVTFGFVSAIERSFRGPRGRRITGSLEHTAPLLPGSSGGPVLDAGGRLLGITPS